MADSKVILTVKGACSACSATGVRVKFDYPGESDYSKSESANESDEKNVLKSRALRPPCSPPGLQTFYSIENRDIDPDDKEAIVYTLKMESVCSAVSPCSPCCPFAFQSWKRFQF